MKIGALFLFFAFAIIPSSAIVNNVLLDYWSQIEQEISPPDAVTDIFIYVEYQNEFKLYKDQTKSDGSILTVIIHEDHYERLKIVCKNIPETLKKDIQSPFRHAHLIIDCASVHERTRSLQVLLEEKNQNEKYVRRSYAFGTFLLILLALFCIGLIAWKMKNGHTFVFFNNFKAFFTDRYRRWRSPVAAQYARFHNGWEESQPDLISLDSHM